MANLSSKNTRASDTKVMAKLKSSKDGKKWQHKFSMKGSMKQKKTNKKETMKHQSPVSVNHTMERIILPKSADEATSNWKKLQAMLKMENESTRKGIKRKIVPKNYRNPKFKHIENDEKDNPKISEDAQQPSEPEIWFDDVDDIFIEKRAKIVVEQVDKLGVNEEEENANPLIKPNAFKGLTKVVGMDCEMVGVGDGNDSMLARVSLVNQYGEPIYDKFVKPKEEVVDYRTHVSGVRAEDLETAEEFEQVQKDVAAILKGRILVGHAIHNDLKVLYLSHPKKNIRDTQKYRAFRQLFGGRNPSLKNLAARLLTVSVQEGEHNSVQDAQATMRLYTMYRKKWEAEIKLKNRERKGIRNIKGTKS